MFSSKRIWVEFFDCVASINWKPKRLEIITQHSQLKPIIWVTNLQWSWWVQYNKYNSKLNNLNFKEIGSCKLFSFVDCFVFKLFEFMTYIFISAFYFAVCWTQLGWACTWSRSTSSSWRILRRISIWRSLQRMGRILT